MTLTSWLSKQRLGSDEYLSEEDLSDPNMAGSMVFYNLIITIRVLVLIIPNFSTDKAEGNFSLPINVVLIVISIGVYSIFLANQMGPFRCFFMDSLHPTCHGRDLSGNLCQCPVLNLQEVLSGPF